MSDAVAVRLKGMEVLDEYGAPVRLGNLWRDRPAVLVFVRHFGCIICRRQVAGLQKILPDISARGARLYVVGMGAITFIAGLRDTTGYQGPVLVDPERKAYRAAALKRSRLGAWHPATLLIGLAAFRAGFTQAPPQGDTAQLGGVFIITPQDRILLTHIEQFAGDTVKPERLLGALK